MLILLAASQWLWLLGSLLWIAYAYRQSDRNRHHRTGWMIHFVEHTLQRSSDGVVQSTLKLPHAQEWSLGVIVDGNEHTQFVTLELRHVRRGPVAQLSRFHLNHHPDSKAVYLDIDTLIDEMAQHLGIRRSGSRLLHDSQVLRNALLK